MIKKIYKCDVNGTSDPLPFSSMTYFMDCPLPVLVLSYLAFSLVFLSLYYRFALSHFNLAYLTLANLFLLPRFLAPISIGTGKVHLPL